VDLTPGNIRFFFHQYLGLGIDETDFKPLNTPSLESAALDSLTLAEYHEICYWEFSVDRDVLVYNPITVDIGAVFSCSSGNRLEDLVEIAFLLQIDSSFVIPRWYTAGLGVVMENGWTRYDISPPLASSNIVQSVSLRSSDAVAKTAISLSVWHLDPNYWLSQANHIFKHLGISSNFEDYGTRFTASW
jgi:hypothetical protein